MRPIWTIARHELLLDVVLEIDERLTLLSCGVNCLDSVKHSEHLLNYQDVVAH